MIQRTRLLALFTLLACLPAAAQAAVISGAVRDYAGTTPIGSIEMRALNSTGAETLLYTTTADALGRYALAVPAGTYLVAANPNGIAPYVPQVYNLAGTTEWATAVDCSTADATGIDFYLTTGYQVGLAVTRGGSPVANAELYAWDPTTYYYAYDLTGARTDAGGRASLNLPQGTFVFTAYSPDGFGYGEIPEPVLVNDAIAELAIALPDFGTIEGSVRGPDAALLDGIGVTAIDTADGYYYGHVQTNDEGFFSLQGLPPDRSYYVLARTRFAGSTAYWGIPSAFYPSAADPGAAAAVTVSAGQVVGNVNIACQSQPATIRGRVLDSVGEPITGALVYDFYRSDRLNLVVPYNQRWDYTDSTGAYELVGLGPTTAGVIVVATGHVAEVYPDCAGASTLDCGAELDLAPGAVLEGVDFVLTAEGSLGDGPAVTSIRPHLLHPGTSATVVVSGSGFDPAARIDLLRGPAPLRAMTAVQLSGRRLAADRLELDVQVPAACPPGPWEVVITNPDGQFTYVYFMVQGFAAAPEMGLSAGPAEFRAGSTMSIGVNLVNQSPAAATADVYIALMIPGGAVVFFNGTTFVTEPAATASGVTLPEGLFVADTPLFSFALEQAVPAGDYSWFAALLDSGNGALIDLSQKRLHSNGT